MNTEIEKAWLNLIELYSKQGIESIGFIHDASLVIGTTIEKSGLAKYSADIDRDTEVHVKLKSKPIQLEV